MQEKAGQFRSAAFGGFHRQDVLHYIEQLTREHQANCERLERGLTEERTARQQAEERLRPGGRSGKSPGRPGKHAGSYPGRTGEDHHCPDPGEGNRSIPGRKTPGYRTRGGFLAANQRHGRRH